MSFPALYLACQAAAHLPSLDDEEFGCSWSDLDAVELDVEWVLYRSGGLGLILGVRDTTLAG